MNRDMADFHKTYWIKKFFTQREIGIIKGFKTRKRIIPEKKLDPITKI